MNKFILLLVLILSVNILGARIKQPRQIIQPQVVILPKLYTWNQKTDKYEIILNKKGDLTKRYPGGIYVQKFNSRSSTPLYEPVHKPKQLQVNLSKRISHKNNRNNYISYCNRLECFEN